ncbi:MAG: SUMF1/EgtB/PvdO family nonheme iron enzyme [Proteobacteria bacterium]|nr:SUMF1/EgtB/PvdO family nonheme iron enzyme [Pseudomonadota bacterium]
MSQELDDFIARHALSDEAARELLALLEPTEGPADASMTFDGGGFALLSPSSSSDEVQRYQGAHHLASGGSGVVQRVHDSRLDRSVAMKSLHPSRDTPARRADLLAEATATAQLDHQNIVPVYDRSGPGEAAWFTMREIRGEPLTAMIEAGHSSDDPARFRRLCNSFRQVCHAVAHAHEQGILHRDLKPDNVMVGRHGQVYVVDWGLARLGTSSTGDVVPRGIRGTPAYMSPEQARGEEGDERTDVYGLGAVLYAILTGRPPVSGSTVDAVIRHAREGRTDPLEAGDLPEDLVAIARRALEPQAAKRYASATAMVEAVEAWLDGVRSREAAMDVVDRALAQVPAAGRMRREAIEARQQAEALLAEVKPWQPVDDKREAWSLEERAEALERSADEVDQSYEQALHSALELSAGLERAHELLAERQRALHQAAEAARAHQEATRARRAFTHHLRHLSLSSPARVDGEHYLRGNGTLSLQTKPTGARVTLHRYSLEDRRLVPGPAEELGATPLAPRAIPMGSYLCILEHPDCATVRYPVEITRLGTWTPERPVVLPKRHQLGQDAIYVPEGWFRVGGDPKAAQALPSSKVWLPAVVIDRFPVTNRQYIRFLDALVAAGREQEALEHVPRERGSLGARGAMIYGRDGAGKFVLTEDDDGDLWLADWPVCMVDAVGAAAFLRWRAEQTGLPWRLPGELEWEKAARGADGRLFPWGDAFDASWACTQESHAEGPKLVTVREFPLDESPYGVRGLAGNMADWCLEQLTTSTDLDASANLPRKIIRGGAWSFASRLARAARRASHEPRYRYSDFGFRGAYTPPWCDPRKG